MQRSALQRHVSTSIAALGGVGLVVAGAAAGPVWAVVLAIPVLTMVLLQLSTVRGGVRHAVAEPDLLVAGTTSTRHWPQPTPARNAEVYDLAAFRAVRGPQPRVEEDEDRELAPVVRLDLRRRGSAERLRAHG